MNPDHDAVPEGQTGTRARKSWKADLASWGGDGGGALFKVVTMVMVVINILWWSVCLSVCHEKWSLPLKVCEIFFFDFFFGFFFWIFFLKSFFWNFFLKIFFWNFFLKIFFWKFFFEIFFLNFFFNFFFWIFFLKIFWVKIFLTPAL